MIPTPGVRQVAGLLLSSAAVSLGLALRLLGRQLARRQWGALLFSLLALPAVALLQAVHWLGFVADEVFFRGYRRVPVDAPVFVLGIPRSGTTLVHRVLAEDAQFTTFTTWEAVLAPSVTERRLFALLGRIDRRLGGHGHRLVDGLVARASRGLEDVHAVALDAPEEDYLALLPVMGCFLAVVAFPFSRRLWRLGRLDSGMTPGERCRLLGFYALVVRKHVYANGPDRRFLSKNAAFASWAGGLREAFPDASFVACVRDPVEVVPSQLSALAAGLEPFGHHPGDPDFRDRILATLEHGYHHLLDFVGRDDRSVLLNESALRGDLEAVVNDVYAKLGLVASPDYPPRLDALARRARGFRSRHRPEARSFGLTGEGIRRRFARVYTRSDSPFGQGVAP